MDAGGARKPSVRTVALLAVCAVLAGCAGAPAVMQRPVGARSPLHAAALSVLEAHTGAAGVVAAADINALRDHDQAFVVALLQRAGLEETGAERLARRTAWVAVAADAGGVAPTRATVLLRGRYGVLPTAVALRRFDKVGRARWSADGLAIERLGTDTLVVRFGEPELVTAAPAAALQAALERSGAAQAVLVAALPDALRPGPITEALRGTVFHWVRMEFVEPAPESPGDGGGEVAALELRAEVSFATERAARAGLVVTRLASAMLLKRYADVDLDPTTVQVQRVETIVRVAEILLSFEELRRVLEAL